MLISVVIIIILFLLYKKYKSKGDKEDSTLAYCPPPYVPLFDSCVLPAPVGNCVACTKWDPVSLSCKPIVCPSGQFCEYGRCKSLR